ncbi:MAG: beta-lactamase family protein [Flavobacteriaceae bacterium]|nr:beta-lactamase family protein [Flavobacteriaceae bacterium]
MNNVIKILILSVFITSCSTRNKEKLILNKKIDSIAVLSDLYLQKLTSLKKFNGAVLLKKDGKVILRKAYNMSQDKNTKLNVSVNSQFDLRSVAKLFAKISVLELEKKGEIKREDLIEKYLPNFPNGDKITINHLMTNTSGLPRSFNKAEKDFILLSPEEVVELASKEKLEFTPGEKERYSNVGFQLLYYIIGKINNKTFSDHLNKTFFTPLKMTKSGGNFDADLSHLDKYAYGHFLNEKKELVCECSFPRDEMKMGHLHSTVEDLSKFLDFLDKDNHKVVVYENTISHSGGTRGKRAYVEKNFKDNYNLIFLSNFDGIPFQKIVEDLQKLLLEKEVDMPKDINRKPTKISTNLLKKYAGTYDVINAGHLIITLKLENDSLYVYQKGNNNGVLYPENDTIFFADKKSEESLEFKKDSLGRYYILLDFQGVRFKGVRIPEK